MGTIYKPKQGTQELVKTINISQTKSFKLTAHLNKDIITFFIGGNDKYCIEIQIYPTSSRFKDFYDITIGSLSQIYYNEGCSIEGGYTKKEDTHNIIRLACSLIRREFQHVTTLTFKDTSEKQCDNGQYIQLSEMYYVLNGKTWYEHNFNAYIEEKYKIKYEEAKESFQIKKRELIWEQFKLFINVDLPLHENEMKDIYNNSASWQEFFTNVKNRIGISKICFFLSPWLHTFLDKFLDFSFSDVKYVLPLINNDSIKPIIFRISDYIKKGGNYTRKAYKKKRALAIQ